MLRLDALLGILITGLVYLVALAPLTDPSGIHAWINAGLHYLASLLAPIGWLLFGPRPRIPGRVVPLALIWPLAWIAYTLLRARRPAGIRIRSWTLPISVCRSHCATSAWWSSWH